ncbi:NPCBM/NEW2 domain-containing protein [Streptomyces sp. NPDC002926]
MSAAEGFGVHAASALEYFADGRCTTVTARVGPDDEKGSKGPVVFEIRADGKRAASADVLTNAMPAQPISADAGGAKVVRPVATDRGDGVDSDHADRAGLRIGC